MSSSFQAPSILQRESQSIPRVVRFFETGNVPKRNCHTKCLNSGGHFGFQEKANSGLTFGPYKLLLWTIFGYKDSVLKPDLTEYLPDTDLQDSVKLHPTVSGFWDLLTANL